MKTSQIGAIEGCCLCFGTSSHGWTRPKDVGSITFHIWTGILSLGA